MEQPLFQIGEVSKMFGIAPETIRHYERKNVLTPAKQEGNRYRAFSVADVCAINQVRSFLRYGFSIDEANALLASGHLEQLEYALMSRAESLEKLIAAQMQVVTALHQRLLNIHSVSNNLGKFRETEIGRFLLAVQGEDDLETVRWFNNQLSAYPFALFERNTFLEGQPKALAMGMCIYGQDLQKAQFIPPERSRELVPGRCIYTGVLLREHTPAKESIRPVVQHLRERDVSVKGDILGRTTAIGQEDGEKVYYMELMIPLAEG